MKCAKIMQINNTFNNSQPLIKSGKKVGGVFLNNIFNKTLFLIKIQF